MLFCRVPRPWDFHGVYVEQFFFYLRIFIKDITDLELQRGEPQEERGADPSYSTRLEQRRSIVSRNIYLAKSDTSTVAGVEGPTQFHSRVGALRRRRFFHGPEPLATRERPDL